MIARPLVVAFAMALIGALLRAAGRLRAAQWLWAAAAVLAYAGASSPVGDALLDPLESCFPALSPASDTRGAAYVAVLGSGYRPRADVPITAALDDEGLARIVEGVRLVRALHLPLIVSGGAVGESIAPALGYARLAGDLGVGADSMIVSTQGVDTQTEALAIAALVKEQRFILVSSAAHMPRAMRLLLRAGAHPIAAPTAQHVIHGDPDMWRYLLPTSIGLRKVEIALHEYLGLAAIRLGYVS